MRWITSSEEARYMRERQAQNILRYSAAEEWMHEHLKTTDYKWTRQAIWGYRLYDFWCHALGIAVEVDGLEHKADYDAYRDRYNFCRSAILVLRVRNFNMADARLALAEIAAAAPWPIRKAMVKPGKALVLANGMKMAQSAKSKLSLET